MIFNSEKSAKIGMSSVIRASSKSKSDGCFHGLRVVTRNKYEVLGTGLMASKSQNLRFQISGLCVCIQ